MHDAAVTIAERNKAAVHAFVAAINAQDWRRLGELVAPDFVRHSYAAGTPEVRRSADLQRFLQSELATFPDACETILDLIAEGDRVAARQRFEGTQHGAMGPYPASGRQLVAEYIAIYRVRAGRVVEAWAEWDTLSGLAQLRHYTPAA